MSTFDRLDAAIGPWSAAREDDSDTDDAYDQYLIESSLPPLNQRQYDPVKMALSIEAIKRTFDVPKQELGDAYRPWDTEKDFEEWMTVPQPGGGPSPLYYFMARHRTLKCLGGFVRITPAHPWYSRPPREFVTPLGTRPLVTSDGTLEDWQYLVRTFSIDRQAPPRSPCLHVYFYANDRYDYSPGARGFVAKENYRDWATVKDWLELLVRQARISWSPTQEKNREILRQYGLEGDRPPEPKTIVSAGAVEELTRQIRNAMEKELADEIADAILKSAPPYVTSPGGVLVPTAGAIDDIRKALQQYGVDVDRPPVLQDGFSFKSVSEANRALNALPGGWRDRPLAADFRESMGRTPVPKEARRPPAPPPPSGTGVQQVAPRIIPSVSEYAFQVRSQLGRRFGDGFDVLVWAVWERLRFNIQTDETPTESADRGIEIARQMFEDARTQPYSEYAGLQFPSWLDPLYDSDDRRAMSAMTRAALKMLDSKAFGTVTIDGDPPEPSGPQLVRKIVLPDDES